MPRRPSQDPGGSSARGASAGGARSGRPPRAGALARAAGRAALVLAGAGIAATPAAPATAQEWKELRTARQARGLSALDVELVYGAGRLSVEPAESDYLYDVRIRYDGARYAPVREWSRTDGTASLQVGLRSTRSEGEGRLRLGEDFDFDLEDLEDLGDSSGRLAMALGPGVPTALRIVAGAAETRLRMGGLSLTRLSVETGASETRLSFDEPNPVAMEELVLKVGAAEFRTENLGNARFRELRFQGGVGDVTLDFSGDWEESARGSVKMGIGALTLRIPRELGVQIRKKSFLTSFQAAELTRVGDVWRTANWAEAAIRLDLELEAAFGSVEVERIP